MARKLTSALQAGDVFDLGRRGTWTVLSPDNGLSVLARNKRGTLREFRFIQANASVTIIEPEEGTS
jgi:hypothetical protein